MRPSASLPFAPYPDPCLLLGCADFKDMLSMFEESSQLRKGAAEQQVRCCFARLFPASVTDCRMLAWLSAEIPGRSQAEERPAQGAQGQGGCQWCGN